MKNIIKFSLLLTLPLVGGLMFGQVSAQSNPFSSISIRYCNDDLTSKELNMIAQAGKNTPICINYINASENPITINVEFNDSVITEGAIKDSACNASDRPKTYFANFIQPYESKTTLPAKSTIQKIYTIKYPIGYSGLSHGCLAYFIAGGDVNGGSMFTVRIRATKFLDFFVTNAQVKQTVKMTKKPVITKVGDEGTISMQISNQGNVDEKIHITSTISNMFGFTYEFTFDQVIGANTGVTLTTPGFILPAYGGLFQLRSKISYTPIFDFNIINGKQPSEIYAGGTENDRTFLFFWTRQSWVVIAIIAVIIIAIIRKIYGRKEEKAANNTLQQ